MSLPDGFLDELRDRVSIADVAARKVSWDRKKSQPNKGDWWAPCPFHQEKTASFHVDDRKGFFYCFGCHAKGDAIAFVRETENVDFMEAVTRLAAQVGMTMPARDPEQQAKVDRFTALSDVAEQAVRWFATQLRSQAGAAARDYLARRGLDAEACARWEIGLAPAGWRGLAEAMGARGVDAQALRDAGLTKVSDKGGAPFDVFRDRIMFPIRDGRGRAIGFGGRALEDGGPKYLNSPQTALFDKSRSLYNLHTARGQSGELILSEGYMDVIALGEAGFRAVAPLGTAVTEDQLRLMWRVAEEPVVMLDGDAAGTRAADRLIDLALPHLGPERSLRFARLPAGSDPDDLLRAEGPGAVTAILGRSEPLVELLWRRETTGRDLDSPERRAALDGRLRAAIGRIGDPGVKRHYGDEIARRRRELFRPAWSPKGRRTAQAAAPRAETRASLLARSDAGEAVRVKVILAALVAHPDLVARFEAPLIRLDPTDAQHARLLDALLAGRQGEDLVAAVGRETLDSLANDPHVLVTSAVRSGDPRAAAAAVAEALERCVAERGASEEIADALEAIAAMDDDDGGMTWRLGEIARARQGSGGGGAAPEHDRADNGVLVDREERAASRGVFDAIDFSKGRGQGKR